MNFIVILFIIVIFLFALIGGFIFIEHKIKTKSRSQVRTDFMANLKLVLSSPIEDFNIINRRMSIKGLVFEKSYSDDFELVQPCSIDLSIFEYKYIDYKAAKIHKKFLDNLVDSKLKSVNQDLKTVKV